MAGLWCVNIGYGRRELAGSLSADDGFAVLQHVLQIDHAARYPSGGKAGATRPARLTKVFFNNSGSEANDTLVRLIRHYWNVQGKPAKKHIISRHLAYHGSTVAAASIGGMSAMHEADLPLPGFHHIDRPTIIEMGKA